VKYILDTNAVSALMRGEASVVATLRGKDTRRP
jgi:predicted nucleic acid-binding protein